MKLIQLALAAEQLLQDRPPITVDPRRCVRATDKSASCERCVQSCPVGAIQLNNGLQVDAGACVRCGACLRSCPTGALDGTDGVHRLLSCVSQLVERETVEIACALHPAPAPGDPDVDAVVQGTGCLAAFGPSVYLSLAALNVHHLRIRLDACAQCPLSMLKPEIEATIQQAQDLLGAIDNPADIAAAPLAQDLKPRHVYSLKNPPVSRRGFFQAFARQSPESLDDLLLANTPRLEGEKSSPRERRRLISALRRLAPDPVDKTKRIPGGGFSHFSVSDACNACELCARVCPTGALALEKSEESFRLTFSTADCTACGLCLNFCDPGALRHDGAPTIAELLASEGVILHTALLQRCRKCNTLFAGESDSGLCPVCAFRRNNPFGVRLPAHDSLKGFPAGRLAPTSAVDVRVDK